MLIFLSVFGWVSCEKNTDPVTGDPEPLIGNWVNAVFEDTMVSYDRVDALLENSFGIAFKKDHVYIERKFIRGFATPPVIQEDYVGTWARHDSLIDIEVPYFGGTAHYQWKIISLDRSTLTYTVVKQEFQE